LISGDSLYVPRGWWRVAKALQPLLSICVGVLSRPAGN
jgi:ribosomal protein L16 Arg81 hydroxylase